MRAISDLNSLPISENQNAMTISSFTLGQGKSEGAHELEGLYCEADNSFYRITFDGEVLPSKQFPKDFDSAEFNINIKTYERCPIEEPEYKKCNDLQIKIWQWLNAKAEIWYEENQFEDDFCKYTSDEN